MMRKKPLEGEWLGPDEIWECLTLRLASAAWDSLPNLGPSDNLLV